MQRLVPSAVAFALLALCTPARADTLKVPADFETITAAVAAAADGDTISVSKGTYLENVVVTTANLKLVGKGAVIDGQYGDTCLEITADGVSVSGFTLVNGVGGLFASGANISISKCTVSSCSGAGIEAEGAPMTISGNTVLDGGGAGIVYLHSAEGEGLLEKNVCLRNGGTGLLSTGDGTTIAKNRCEQNQGIGIDVVVDVLSLGAFVPQPVLVSKNTSSGNGNDGMVLLNGTTALVTVEKNTCSGNDGSGVFVDAVNLILSKNTCDRNAERGLDLALSGGTVEKNSATGNQQDGIRITSALDIADGGGFGFGDDNSVIGNTCKDNRGDGIVILVGDDNTLDSNKCTGNGDDGIDVEGPSCTDTQLLDNTCSDNGHEGIDNSGEATVITGNVCKNNGYGIGPDIAGHGDGGLGTVSTFEDNKFTTGGETDPSRMDNYVNTGL